MQSLKISDLIPHPKNDFFFDDITGEKWKEFVNSIRDSGVRTPIIVTDQMVIVSGNQRVRACKELGITVIDAEVKHYASEDEVVKDLIEANIRQRGVISDSEIKAGRRLAELQRINGIVPGNPSQLRQNVAIKTQADIAKELGISEREIQRLIRLSKAEPEIQQLVEDGTVTKTAALNIISKLSQDEQKELAERLSGGEKQTGAEVQKLISDIADRDRRIAELQNRPPEIREVIKPPSDYDMAKLKAQKADGFKKDYDRLYAERTAIINKMNAIEKENKQLREEAKKPDIQRENGLRLTAVDFVRGVNRFLEQFGGYAYLMDELGNLPEKERADVERAVSAVHEWAETMLCTTVSEVIG